METQFNVSSIFGLYASLTAFLTLIKQFYYQFIPDRIREYIDEKIKNFINRPKILDPKIFTLVINDVYNDSEHGYDYRNDVYKACETYLSYTLRSHSTRLEGCRQYNDDRISYLLAQGEEYIEYVRLDAKLDHNVKLRWKFICRNDKGEVDDSGGKKSFELSFDPRYKDQVLDNYLPLVVVKNYDKMIEMKKEIYLYTYDGIPSRSWHDVSFNHPFTFDALALDPELKKSIVEDLDRFIKRKEFYKRIGRAWKRGYLLYGPPGTGKSSLIAAIANYLKFNIYDLQLGSVDNDATLRKLMMNITNKSILVIEDIDCASGLSKNAALTREYDACDYDDDDDDNDDGNSTCGINGEEHQSKLTLSLSGLLNFIDGLWSSCGDERIIILTTNYKERLDAALLRPGRMDMHIHMSYLRMPGFRILASNYLGITGEHPVFEKIEELIQTTDVSPAEAAEELIRSDDPDIALAGVVKMLQEKKSNQISLKIKKQKQKSKKKKKGMKGKDKDAGELTDQAGEC